MGLYSTDTSTGNLSNINEEKSVTPRMSRKEIKLLEQKQFPPKSRETSGDGIVLETENGQLLTKPSNEEKNTIKNKLETNHFQENEIGKVMNGKAAEDINKNIIITSQSNSTKTTTNGEGSKRVSLFPLYDTESEDEEEVTNLSDMAVRCRNITRVLGKIRRDLVRAGMQ